MGGTRGATGNDINGLWVLGSNTNQQLFIFISKGEIIGTHEGRGPSNGEIKLEDIKLDSSHLVKSEAKI